MAKQLTVQELVREKEKNFTSGTETTISKYVQFDLYENINRIDAYLNSKHISGSTDSKGREKPFFNIVTSAVNIWYRATDIDRKNIMFRATKKKQKVLALMASVLLTDWMNKNAFGQFLNEWGRTLSRYGSAISKFVDKGGELHAEVIPWSRIICDTVDFENNPKIEKLYFTPSQLRANKNYNQVYVEQILEKNAGEARETPEGEAKDNMYDYIPVYEVHGELPLSYLTDKFEDEDEYVQQMNVVCFIESKDQDGKTYYEDFSLFKGPESQDPYQLDHLIAEDGRSQSIGAVEHLFDAQWIVNDSAKKIKDQLELASKVFFQTSDGNFVGKNALSNMDNGDILITAKNEPLTQVNSSSHDITSLQGFQGQWQALGREINGISEAMASGEVKAGAAWRQTQALLNESHSLFELMTENKGLALENMLRKYILPNFKKKLDTSDEISTLLSEQQINQIDSIYLPKEVIKRVNQKKINTILSGQIYEPEQEELDTQDATMGLEKELKEDGNQRFIKPSEVASKTWKEMLKDFEFEIEIDITGENKDKQGALATLGTALQVIAGMGGQPMPPEMKLVFNKILSLSGEISPLEINQVPTPQAQPTAQPQVQQQPVAPVAQPA